MNFQRCARTDKGVSAAVNVVSLKIRHNALCKLSKFVRREIRSKPVKFINGLNGD